MTKTTLEYIKKKLEGKDIEKEVREIVEERYAKLNAVKQWLEYHGSSEVGNFVFDNTSLITEISANEMMGYHIKVKPIKSTHNIGCGCGNPIKIDFNNIHPNPISNDKAQSEH